MGEENNSTNNESLATRDTNSNGHPTTEARRSSIMRELTLMAQESLSIEKRHKFWETQPVGQPKDIGDTTLPEGPIKQPTPLSQVQQEPDDLPDAFEWITCDMDSKEMGTEVYNLLVKNYVEDDENMFRLSYSKEFLKWVLCPPGYYKSWHVGVRIKGSRKLVAFITGVPARIRVRCDVITMAEVNFLCVHKKLRSKRLAPVLIKEVTRRVHLENVWQAVYTAGVVLPTPIARCQYWHRPLNPKKLIEVEFSRIGPKMIMSRTIKLYKLPDSTVTPGFRTMELRDVPAVTRLLRSYLTWFVIASEFDENEVEYWLLPREDVIDAYVVEDPHTHEITDFCSFYIVLSTIIGNPNYQTLKAAYSYYNVATKTPLIQLINDALIMAKNKDCDFFNALDIMENASFFKASCIGQLQYYLYNYRLRHPVSPSQLGLVLFSLILRVKTEI